jgi:hypothetical protein
MTIRLSCPSCGRPVDCPDDRAGMVEICPHCQEKMRVPDTPRRDDRPRRDRPRRRERIDVPANTSLREVGEPLREFKVTGATFKLVIGIVLCVFGVPFLLFPPLGLAFLGIGIWLIVTGVRGSGRRLIICEDGFLDCRGSDTLDVTWLEVDAVYEKITRFVNEWGAHIRTEFLYTVVLESGKTYTYTQEFSDVETLGNQLQRGVAEAHFPRALKALENGKWLDFDDIRISRRGIELHGDRLPWDEVGEFSAENGYLSIYQRFSNREFAQVAFAKIPNVKLLTMLIEEATSR